MLANWRASRPSVLPRCVRGEAAQRPARQRRLGGAQIIGAEAKQRNIELIGELHLFSYTGSLLYALIAACKKKRVPDSLYNVISFIFILFVLLYIILLHDSLVYLHFCLAPTYL